MDMEFQKGLANLVDRHKSKSIMSKACQQTLANKDKETVLQSRDVNHNQLKSSAMVNILGESINFDFATNVSIMGDGASATT